jgi:hypothetical protein
MQRLKNDFSRILFPCNLGSVHDPKIIYPTGIELSSVLNVYGIMFIV